eukprot:1187561-Pyramimonas_sp.AAC.1
MSRAIKLCTKDSMQDVTDTPEERMTTSGGCISEILKNRNRSHIVLLFTHSHLEASDIVAGRGQSWLVRGNAAAGLTAGEAASRCQIPKQDRFRVNEWEMKVCWVRMRFLRATLDALA